MGDLAVDTAVTEVVPTTTWDDPWVDAARSVVLVDLPSFPSAHRPHAWKQDGWVGPTLDLNVALHRPASGSEWLLCRGTAPLSTGGLYGWRAEAWDADRRLVASGGGQCIWRPPRA